MWEVRAASSRDEAIELGLKFYVGDVCQRGHSPPIRYVSTRQCKACQAWHVRDYRAADRQAYLAKGAAYREANREQINERAAVWRKANPEKLRAKCLRDYHKLPDEKKREKLQRDNASRRVRVAKNKEEKKRLHADNVKKRLAVYRIDVSQIADTKAIAIELGLKYWRDDCPCLYGHVPTIRRIRNGNCVACGSNRSNKWGQANPEKVAAYVAAYHQSNPDVALASAARRRARVRGVGGSFTKDDVADLMKIQKGKCAYYFSCNRKISSRLRNFHVDHIVPISGGGTNNRDNIQLLCPRCNLYKSAKDPIAFAQELGKLL